MDKKNSSTASLKTQAKALQAYLKRQEVGLGHSKCLEAVAQMHGFKNWDAASASFEEPQLPLFTVSNHHVAGCGEPPSINGDGSGYVSYFENSEGEQAVFTWDRKAKRGTLHMGDRSWDQPIEVGERGQMTPLTVLTREEGLWFRSCLAALGLLSGMESEFSRPTAEVLTDVRHDLMRIERAIRAYVKEHGQGPSVTGGDASEHAGYKTTWVAINSWLGTHPQEVGEETVRSLLQYCRALGFEIRQHDPKRFGLGVRAYVKEHGRPPSTRSGDASKHVGYKTSWKNVNAWLRNNPQKVKGEMVSSLFQYCRALGFDGGIVGHDSKKVEPGIRAYVKEHGRRPSTRSGDATKYVGYKTTWAAINQWLRTRGSDLKLA